MNPITFKGISYESIAALAMAHGLDGHTVSNRIRQGHTLKHALSAGQLKGRTLSKINTRAEWLVSLGWSVEGLCTSGIWELWGTVLAKIYKDLSGPEIAAIVGVAPRTIQKDIKDLGIETRGKGGANYRGKEHYRRAQRVGINEVREMQMERRRRVSEQNGGRLRGLEA